VEYRELHSVVFCHSLAFRLFHQRARWGDGDVLSAIGHPGVAYNKGPVLRPRTKRPYPEEPREGKALMRGSGVSAGWATTAADHNLAQPLRLPHKLLPHDLEQVCPLNLPGPERL
jgi:hypothetical protein